MDPTVVEAIPAVIGFIGNALGKGGREEVKPEQVPSVSEEMQPSYEAFAKMLEGFLTGGQDVLKPEVPWSEADYGPTDIGEAGQRALGEIEGGAAKPVYGYLPEEEKAGGYLSYMLGPEYGAAAREKARTADEAAYNLASRLLKQQSSDIRGQYARGGQLYSSAPIEAQTRAAESMGTALAERSANRAAALEQALLGLQAGAAPTLAAIGGQRTQRGLAEARLGLEGIRDRLKTGELQSQLRQEVARRRILERARQERMPFDRLQMLASIFGALRPGESYWPMTEPSGFNQALGASSDFLPGVWDALSKIFGWGDGNNDSRERDMFPDIPGEQRF